MSQPDREAIKAAMQTQLDAMDEPTRQAAIHKRQAWMLLINAPRKAG